MLPKYPYKQLTTNEIEARGWLKRQLRLQADGLSGHLQEVWPDISQSQWIGGDREGWERVPYWLDGFIPLAYLLGDEKLIADAKRYVDFIIEKQIDDKTSGMWHGWICPVKDNDELFNFDDWAVILIAKALIVYHDCSGDERIPDVIHKILWNLHFRIEHQALHSWGSYRWFETLIAIYWLYERTGEDWLISFAHNLNEQGADYKKIFRHWFGKKVPLSWNRNPDGVEYPKVNEHWGGECVNRLWSLRTHVVNLAMALKSEALYSTIMKFEGEECDPDEFAEHMYQSLIEYHGTAVGHFTGDECISGTSPVHGTELCGVVEAMYSYEWLYAITGKSKWLDRAEQLAYNALPATISEDMWSHQYNQMTNQIACPKFEDHSHTPFLTNGGDGNLFGLEPNYGCCTSNFSQGWPKFALSTFMRSEKGLASTILAPSAVKLEINGAKVCCELDTDYPFSNKLTYTITTDRSVEFEFEYRIPDCVNFATANGRPVSAGKNTITRTFDGEYKLEVELDMTVRFEKRPNDLLTLYRGPLAYSLPIDENWEMLEYTDDGVERKYPYCDYEVTPKSDWAFGFTSGKVEFHENTDWDLPFTRKACPVWAEVEVAPINWGYLEGFEGKVCREQPLERKALGEPRKVKFMPYAIPKLRMTELPFIDEN